MVPMLELLVLRSADIEACKQFYAVLGVAFKREKHGAGPEHYAGLCGEMVLEIYPTAANIEPKQHVRLGFGVRDLAHTVAALEQAEYRIRRHPYTSQWGFRAVVVDPDGRSVELRAIDDERKEA